MKSRWVLTDEDVRDLLAVVERWDAAGDGDFFYPEVLAGLRGLIPCNEITFELLDVREQRIRHLWVDDDGARRRDFVGPQDEFHQMFWQEFWNDDGCAGSLLSGDYTTVRRHSDRWTERDFANTPLGSMYAAVGRRHEVLVQMTPHEGIDRRLLLWRHEGSDFTERELAMLRLIRPHLAELYARRARELRGAPNLTPDAWNESQSTVTILLVMRRSSALDPLHSGPPTGTVVSAR